jgi:hypothetical protein
MIFPGTVEAMVLLYQSNKMRLILTVQRNLGKRIRLRGPVWVLVQGTKRPLLIMCQLVKIWYLILLILVRNVRSTVRGPYVQPIK